LIADSKQHQKFT